MIEANNPEINVDELMEKIRQEVERRQNYGQSLTSIVKVMSSRSHSTFELIESLINTAELRAQVRTKWPDNLNRFPFTISKKIQKIFLKALEIIFKDQYEVNFNFLKAFKESLTLNRRLFEQIETLQSHFDVVVNRLSAINERVSELDHRLNVIDGGTHLTNQRLNLIDEHVGKLDQRLSLVDEHVGKLDQRLSLVDEHVGKLDQRLSLVDERLIRNDSYFKNELAQQKRLITLFLEEARQRLPEPFTPEQLQTIVAEEQHLLDTFYANFEDCFRGNREQIIDRLKVYLPLIQKAKVDTQNAAILDVGCGRGEWLELLHQSGYSAQGIDINRVTVEACQARGFDVIETDALSHLQAISDQQLDILTGFHIIEHLPFATLIKLITETVRVLKPGGLVIFETPNPKNLVVGACNFYSDPTHNHPIFPETLQLLLEFYGLSNVQIMYLNPVETSSVEEGKLTDFHNWFFGPRDYAVIGYK